MSPSLFAKIYRERFVSLLISLVLFVLAVPAIRQLSPILAQRSSAVFFTLFLAACVFAVADTRQRVTVSLTLMIPVLLCSMVEQRDDIWLVLKHLLSVVFIAYTSILVLRHVYRSRTVTRDTISAALCVYLLLGLGWAFAYSWVELQHPGAFRLSDGTKGTMILGSATDRVAYFSFVTLTTLGYGDIVPAMGISRTLVVLESIVGPVYLTVLVARLVGIQVAQDLQRDDRKDSPQATTHDETKR